MEMVPTFLMEQNLRLFYDPIAAAEFITESVEFLELLGRNVTNKWNFASIKVCIIEKYR